MGRLPFAVVVLLAACGGPRPPDPEVLARLPVVTVDVAPNVRNERRAVFEREQGRTRLRDAILAELADADVLGVMAGDRVEVTVTGFRLRSTAAAFWAGWYAGADVLDVRVAVVPDGRPARTFETGAAGVMGGIFKPTADGRFDGLVEAVAERVADAL